MVGQAKLAANDGRALSAAEREQYIYKKRTVYVLKKKYETREQYKIKD